MTKKSIKHASANVGLIFTAYNLQRIFNIIDQKLLNEYLKVMAHYFDELIGFLTLFTECFFFVKLKATFYKKNFNSSLNHIYLLAN
jgi:hypothetical protein